jgi:hypothetical protein
MSEQLHACCRHCDPFDDWHITMGSDAHEDTCPYACNSEAAS